jgi:hypothetical protein
MYNASASSRRGLYTCCDNGFDGLDFCDHAADDDQAIAVENEGKVYCGFHHHDGCHVSIYAKHVSCITY